MIIITTLLILVSVTLWIKWKRLAWAWPTSVLVVALLGAIFNHPWVAAFIELAIIIAFLVYFSKKTGKRLVVLPAGFKRNLRKTSISAGVAAVALVAVGGLVLMGAQSGSLDAVQPPKAQLMPPAAAAPSLASTAATCQADAINAYASQQGFTKGQYAVGANNADTSLPEFSSGGALRFSQPITSQALLAKTFKSSEPAAQVAVQRVKSEFTNYSDSVLLNAGNWQMVQWLVPTNLVGNTGFSNGKAVDAGTRTSAKGDAEWLFVDPVTCKVPTAKVSMETTAYTVRTDSTQATSSTAAVPLIRVGCGNPGKNIVPTTPAPPRTTPPPPTHTTPPSCVQPASPGSGYTWNQAECQWTPPVTTCPYGTKPNGDCMKSGDTNDYQQPGTDDTTDSGTGTKPPAPGPTTPASSPAPVQTTTTSPSGVTDSTGGDSGTAPSLPGSETGGTAPGATTPTGPSTDQPTTSSSPSPSPSPSDDGGTHVDTSQNQGGSSDGQVGGF